MSNQTNTTSLLESIKKRLSKFDNKTQSKIQQPKIDDKNNSKKIYETSNKFNEADLDLDDETDSINTKNFQNKNIAEINNDFNFEDYETEIEDQNDESNDKNAEIDIESLKKEIGYVDDHEEDIESLKNNEKLSDNLKIDIDKKEQLNSAFASADIIDPIELEIQKLDAEISLKNNAKKINNLPEIDLKNFLDKNFIKDEEILEKQINNQISNSLNLENIESKDDLKDIEFKNNFENTDLKQDLSKLQNNFSEDNINLNIEDNIDKLPEIKQNNIIENLEDDNLSKNDKDNKINLDENLKIDNDIKLEEIQDNKASIHNEVDDLKDTKNDSNSENIDKKYDIKKINQNNNLYYSDSLKIENKNIPNNIENINPQNILHNNILNNVYIYSFISTIGAFYYYENGDENDASMRFLKVQDVDLKIVPTEYVKKDYFDRFVDIDIFYENNFTSFKEQNYEKLAQIDTIIENKNIDDLNSPKNIDNKSLKNSIETDTNIKKNDDSAKLNNSAKINNSDDINEVKNDDKIIENNLDKDSKKDPSFENSKIQDYNNKISNNIKSIFDDFNNDNLNLKNIKIDNDLKFKYVDDININNNIIQDDNQKYFENSSIKNNKVEEKLDENEVNDDDSKLQQDLELSNQKLTYGDDLKNYSSILNNKTNIYMTNQNQNNNENSFKDKDFSQVKIDENDIKKSHEISQESPNKKSIDVEKINYNLIHEEVAYQANNSIKKLIEAKNLVNSVNNFVHDQVLTKIAVNLLEPKLEKWLNENLPNLVEEIVKQEIEKIVPKD